MSLKDVLDRVLHRKASGADPVAVQSAEEEPNFYSSIKNIDEDLFAAVSRLHSLANDILAEAPEHNPDATALMAEYTAFLNKETTDWVNANYSLPAVFAQEYGKAWMTSNAKDAFEAVCKASMVADPEAKAAFKQAWQLIAVAAAAMLVHYFFLNAYKPSSAASRNALETTAAAKAFVFGL